MGEGEASLFPPPPPPPPPPLPLPPPPLSHGRFFFVLLLCVVGRSCGLLLTFFSSSSSFFGVRIAFWPFLGGGVHCVANDQNQRCRKGSLCANRHTHKKKSLLQYLNSQSLARKGPKSFSLCLLGGSSGVGAARVWVVWGAFPPRWKEDKWFVGGGYN